MNVFAVTTFITTRRSGSNRQKRWDDNTTIVQFQGEYSSFFAKKLSKIFSDVIPESAAAGLTTTKRPSSRFEIKIPVGKQLAVCFCFK